MSRLDVSILSRESPTNLAVLPDAWKVEAILLQQQLNDHFNNPASRSPLLTRKDESGEAGSHSLITNFSTVCCVLHENNWRRAQVIASRKVAGKVTLKLVDAGEIVEVPSCKLFDLPAKFLARGGFALFCHIQGVPITKSSILDNERNEAAWLEMQQLLPRSTETVKLVRKGSPLPVPELLGILSLPCDLEWTRVIHMIRFVVLPIKVVQVGPTDPFSPNYVENRSLLNMCVAQFEIMFAQFDPADETLPEIDSENNEYSEDNEFSHVVAMHPNPGFQWLQPELPALETFSARGILVDESGLIYMQLHSQRETVRVLKRLLNEKFENSKPAQLAEDFLPGQEVCCKWSRDGNWYRARFRGYLDSEGGRCQVVLVRARPRILFSNFS